MSYQIRITDPAAHDMAGIRQYIVSSLLEPRIALSVLREMNEKITALEDFPNRYELVREPYLAAQGIRKMLVSNFLVFYTVNDAALTVTILRGLYGKHNWMELL